MSLYTKEQVNELKSKIDYFEFYQKFLPDLTQRGRLAWCICPWHRELKPSFSVDVNTGMFKCWGENIHGDIFSFYTKHFNTNFNNAIEQIAEMYNYELIISDEERAQRDYIKSLKDINKLIGEKYQLSLKGNIDAWNYLTDIRGFSPKIVEYFKLGCGINKLPNKESLKTLGLLKEKENKIYPTFFDNRVIIPRIDENGNIVSFTGRLYKDDFGPKYLHTTNTPIYEKSNFVFGLYQAKKYIKSSNSVICVEGELDMIKCYQKGILNTVSISGLNISDEQVNLLKKYTNNFYICLEDEAPLRQNEKKETSIDKIYNTIKRNIPYAKIYIIDLRLSDGSKQDPDMYLKNHNRDDFKELIKNAKIYNEFIINTKIQNINPKNIEEKTACLNMVAPLLANINNFMDRKQYIELVANKLMMSENDIYRKIKYINENQDKLNNKNLTWDSRPVYAQKILLSMCFCPNFNTLKVLGYIKMFALKYMEQFYKNIFNDYIYEYVKNNKDKLPIDYNSFFSELIYNKNINNVIKDIIMDIYFKVDTLEDFTEEDVEDLIKEQIETLQEYEISKINNLEDELNSIDI